MVLSREESMLRPIEAIVWLLALAPKEKYLLLPQSTSKGYQLAHNAPSMTIDHPASSTNERHFYDTSLQQGSHTSISSPTLPIHTSVFLCFFLALRSSILVIARVDILLAYHIPSSLLQSDLVFVVLQTCCASSPPPPPTSAKDSPISPALQPKIPPLPHSIKN